MKTIWILAILATAGLFGGCQLGQPKYYRVVTMDHYGKLVSSWVAKGAVLRRESGYRFTAYERQIGDSGQTYRYPQGRRVHVICPETVIYRVEEPEWLAGLTPLEVADESERKAGFREERFQIR